MSKHDRNRYSFAYTCPSASVLVYASRLIVRVQPIGTVSHDNYYLVRSIAVIALARLYRVWYLFCGVAIICSVNIIMVRLWPAVCHVLSIHRLSFFSYLSAAVSAANTPNAIYFSLVFSTQSSISRPNQIRVSISMYLLRDRNTHYFNLKKLILNIISLVY